MHFSVRRLDLLATTGFGSALALLLLNDFVFKAVFVTWWTGKLSDFAGLAAFVIFWTALFPRQRRVVFLITAFGFLLWKSPVTTPMLGWWNSLGVWPLARVVDLTDCIALIILPIVYRYVLIHLDNVPRPTLPGLKPALALCAMFAFAATSHVVKKKDGSTYDVPGAPDVVMRRVIERGFIDHTDSDGRYPNPFEVYLGDMHGSVLLELSPSHGGQTTVTLVEYSAVNRLPEPGEVYRVLADQVIQPLSANLDAEDRRQRCVAVRYGHWDPVVPRSSNPRAYVMPPHFVMTGLKQEAYSYTHFPFELTSWQRVIRAPEIPHDILVNTFGREIEFTRSRRKDRLPFLSWAAWTPDSVAFAGTDESREGREATIEVQGRWVEERFSGRALWIGYNGEARDSSRAAVTGIRYPCVDVQAGARAAKTLAGD